MGGAQENPDIFRVMILITSDRRDHIGLPQTQRSRSYTWLFIWILSHIIPGSFDSLLISPPQKHVAQVMAQRISWETYGGIFWTRCYNKVIERVPLDVQNVPSVPTYSGIMWVKLPCLEKTNIKTKVSHGITGCLQVRPEPAPVRNPLLLLHSKYPRRSLWEWGFAAPARQVLRISLTGREALLLRPPLEHTATTRTGHTAVKNAVLTEVITVFRRQINSQGKREWTESHHFFF